jgi:NAD(P)H-hydrate repair Nnr-like enzyme with NAD(P)H-hydrate dehydratase domain
MLAAGGSGDLLAGIVAGLCCRKRTAVFDPYTCACAAAALLIAAGKSIQAFADPLDTAKAAARMAGEAWL